MVGGDPDVSRTLQVYLDSHQFSVQAVRRGDEALATCRQAPPDAIVLNWQLPDTNGNELCQQIRANAETEACFIVALLPTNDRKTRLAALEAGADDVMSQPIDIEKLRLRIEGML